MLIHLLIDRLSLPFACCVCNHSQPVGRFNGKSYQPGAHTAPANCEETGSGLKVGGPIWGAPLHSQPFLAKALRRVRHATAAGKPAANSANPTGNNAQCPTHARLHGLLVACSEELPDVPLYYTLPALSASVHCTSPPLMAVQNAICNVTNPATGVPYRVSASHRLPEALKTDAPPSVLCVIAAAAAAAAIAYLSSHLSCALVSCLSCLLH